MNYNEYRSIAVGRIKRRRSIVSRTLADLSNPLHIETAILQSLKVPRWLQKLEPRIKIIGFTVLLISVTLVHSPLLLVLIVAGSFIIAASSHLPLKPVVFLWSLTAAVSLAVSFPSMFNLVTQGVPVFTLGWQHILWWQFDHPIAVTGPGLLVMSRFVLRALSCVSIVSLVTLSTQWSNLFSALRSIGVPKMWILMMMMTQRYLYALSNQASEMYLARRSRSNDGWGVPGATRWTSSRIGALFGLSRRLADEISMAMTARGFTGDIYLRKLPAPRPGDAILGFMLLVAAALVSITDIYLR